jgi:transposase
MKPTVIAIDIAKTVFQLHWVEPTTGEIHRLKLKRDKLLAWLANREPSLVLMEACGGAHEWGRQFVQLGHDVRLISARSVRPFVQRNKTDAADAHAIWTAGQQPGAKFVALKTDAQQVVLSLHRIRAQLMKMRVMQTNAFRGLRTSSASSCPRDTGLCLQRFPLRLPQPRRGCRRCSLRA